MPILENDFKCPNGHSFVANAKVRARCPECGTLTKRFGRAPILTKPELVVAEGVTPSETPSVIPGVQLLRQGKRTMATKTPAKPARKGPPKGVIPPQFLKNKKPSAVVHTRPGLQKSTPMITKRPKKMATARVTNVSKKSDGPVWHQVASWLGF
jgi:hypothetical protein